jgi:hypothetical protein
MRNPVSYLLQVCPGIIGWMMKTVRSVMTVKVSSRLGGANIIAVYAVNFIVSLFVIQTLNKIQVKYSVLVVLPTLSRVRGLELKG